MEDKEVQRCTPHSATNDFIGNIYLGKILANFCEFIQSTIWPIL